jgi:hypothetical protein
MCSGTVHVIKTISHRKRSSTGMCSGTWFWKCEVGSMSDFCSWGLHELPQTPGMIPGTFIS